MYTLHTIAQAFIKTVNYQHIMPTRYTLDVDLKSVVTNWADVENTTARVEARKVCVWLGVELLLHCCNVCSRSACCGMSMHVAQCARKQLHAHCPSGHVPTPALSSTRHQSHRRQRSCSRKSSRLARTGGFSPSCAFECFLLIHLVCNKNYACSLLCNIVFP